MSNIINQVHDPTTGKIDGILFSEFLSVKIKEMSSLIGVSDTGLRKNPTSDKFKPTLNRLYILVNNLRFIFGGSIKDALFWLHAPNPHLGDKTPLRCIFQEKKLEEVEELVDAMETGRLI